MQNNIGINDDDSITYLKLTKKTIDYLTKKKKFYTMGDLLNRTERELYAELPLNIFEEVKTAIENLGLAFAISLEDEILNVQSDINKMKNSIAKKENMYNKLVNIFNDSERCKELVNLIIERQRLEQINSEMDAKIEDIKEKIVNNSGPQKTLV